MNKTLIETLREAYLDYVNNFLTVDGFAEYYGISPKLARAIISEMKNS